MQLHLMAGTVGMAVEVVLDRSLAHQVPQEGMEVLEEEVAHPLDHEVVMVD